MFETSITKEGKFMECSDFESVYHLVITTTTI